MELSAGLTEEAWTRTSTSFGEGVGAGRSSRSSGGVSKALRVTAFNFRGPFWIGQLLMAWAAGWSACRRAGRVARATSLETPLFAAPDRRQESLCSRGTEALVLSRAASADDDRDRAGERPVALSVVGADERSLCVRLGGG